MFCSREINNKILDFIVFRGFKRRRKTLVFVVLEEAYDQRVWGGARLFYLGRLCEIPFFHNTKYSFNVNYSFDLSTGFPI